MESTSRLVTRWVSLHLPEWTARSSIVRANGPTWDSLVSVPVRRNGRRTLRSIPAEIYLLIFDQICQDAKTRSDQEMKTTMLAVSLVCKFFRVASLRSVFCVVTLPYLWPQYLRKAERGEEWLGRLTAHDPNAHRCAELVGCLLLRARQPNYYTSDDRDWRLFRRMQDYLSPQPHELPTEAICLRALPAFSQLSMCYLTKFPISMPLLTTLAALPRLLLLSIASAPCTRGLPTPLTNICGRGLLVLEVKDCAGLTNDWITVIQQFIDQRILGRLETDQPALLDGILGSRTAPTMGRLCVNDIRTTHDFFHGQDPSVVVLRWLSHCPNLISLTLVGLTILDPIPDSICPSLQRISCSPSTARLFMRPGRPISSFACSRVTGIELVFLRQLIRALTVRTISVAELGLPLRELDELLSRSTLVVQNFTIYIVYSTLNDFIRGPILARLERDAMSILCTTLNFQFDVPRSSNFGQDVHVGQYFRVLDLVGQKWLLDQAIMRNVFPRLDSMGVNGFILWRRAPSDGHWFPAITHVDALAAFIEGPVLGEVRDVDDCLSKALGPLRIHPTILRNRGLRPF